MRLPSPLSREYKTNKEAFSQKSRVSRMPFRSSGATINGKILCQAFVLLSVSLLLRRNSVHFAEGDQRLIDYMIGRILAQASNQSISKPPKIPSADSGT